VSRGCAAAPISIAISACAVESRRASRGAPDDLALERGEGREHVEDKVAGGDVSEVKVARDNAQTRAVPAQLHDEVAPISDAPRHPIEPLNNEPFSRRRIRGAPFAAPALGTSRSQARGGRGARTPPAAWRGSGSGPPRDRILGYTWAPNSTDLEVPMSTIPRPDLSARPLQTTCEYTVNAKPEDVYAAWTNRFDIWFAQAGTLEMVAKAGRPYFFYNRDDWGRHPHYGRFLEVVENKLVEMTWITGNGTPEGTEGAETVLRIELVPKGTATEVRLTHSGFVNERSRDGHKENWPLALKILDEALS
jgi:uncharacterized protein YndB with AHSA1/START domain